MEKEPKIIPVNCFHSKCPNCGVEVDIIPKSGTCIVTNEDVFRNFIRTNHLTKKWDEFIADNN